MKVVHLISHLAVGGAENVVKTICLEGPKEKKYKQYVIGFRKNRDLNYSSYFKKKLEGQGIEVFELEGHNDIHRFFELIKILKTIGPNIIHTHTELPDFFGGIASLLFPKAKLCRTVHNTLLWPEHKVLDFITNSIFKFRGSGNIAVSNAAKSAFENKYRQKSIVIENPVRMLNHCKRNVSREFQEMKILMIGRLTEQKNFELALEALKKVNENIKYKCYIVGNGPEKEKLEKIVQESNLKHSVFFEGFKKIDDVIDGVDLVISPSIFEGLNITIVEAISASKPVIASDIAPHKEIIGENDFGLTFKSKDINDLIEKIEFSYFNYDQMLQKSRKGADSVREKFNPQKRSLEYFDFYKKIFWTKS